MCRYGSIGWRRDKGASGHVRSVLIRGFHVANLREGGDGSGCREHRMIGTDIADGYRRRFDEKGSAHLEGHHDKGQDARDEVLTGCLTFSGERLWERSRPWRARGIKEDVPGVAMHHSIHSASELMGDSTGQPLMGFSHSLSETNLSTS